MEYRVLGKTNLRVSTLSLGASALGGGVYGPVSERDALHIVKRALDLGINFIDVAPFYGKTLAETVLGKALRGIPRESYILATKVGRYGDAEFDFSPGRVKRSVDESLMRLGVDYVDIIQSHDIEYTDLNQVIDQTLPALREIQQIGKARFVGVTGYPLAIFPRILGQVEVDTILSYNHHTLIDSTLVGLLPSLQSKRIGLINASPMSQGLLTNQGAPPWHPAPQKVKDLCAEVAKYCEARGTDISKLAVQFSVANPNIATTLLGTAKAEDMEKCVRWIEEPTDLDLLTEVTLKLGSIKDQVWTTGLPENN